MTYVDEMIPLIIIIIITSDLLRTPTSRELIIATGELNLESLNLTVKIFRVNTDYCTVAFYSYFLIPNITLTQRDIYTADTTGSD